MKKAICLFIFVIAVTSSIWLYHERAFAYLISITLNSYCQNKLGLDCHTNRIYYSNGKWIIDQLSLRENGKEIVNANKSELFCNFFPYQWKLDVDFTLDTPILTHPFVQKKGFKWDISQGNIDVKLSWTNREDYTIQVRFHDIVAQYPSMHLKALIPKAECTFSPKKGNFNFTQSASLSIALHPQHIIHFSSLNGGVQFSENDFLKITLDGVYQQGKQEVHSFFLTGKANLLGVLELMISSPSTENTYIYLEPTKLSEGLNLKGKINEIDLFLDFDSSGNRFVDIKSWPEWLYKLNHISFSNGKFQAQKIDLNRYLSKSGVDVRGIADVDGFFNASSLVLNLKTDHLIVKNDKGSFEIPQTVTAIHYFDFSSNEQGGILHLENGIFREISSALELSGISGLAIWNRNCFTIQNAQGYCEGLFLNGEVNLLYPKGISGPWNTEVYADNITGNFSQLSDLLSKLEIPFSIPIEGNLSLRTEGAFLNITSDDMDLIIHGSLSEGSMKSDGFNIALEDIGFNFDYNHRDKSLEITDMQGALICEGEADLNEYILSGDRIVFSNFLNFEGNFDLWIGDRNRDILRLAGHTAPSAQNPNHIEILLDHTHSHFGAAYPKNSFFVIDRNLKLQKVEISFSFDLKNLLSDIQIFSRTGVVILPSYFLCQLNNVKTAAGLFDVFISYNSEMDLTYCKVDVNNLVFAEKTFEKGAFKGFYRDRKWIIENLSLDDYAISAELSRNETCFDIHFLGIRWRQCLMAGMQGKYFPNDEKFEGSINFLEIDLEHIKEWNFLGNFSSIFKPMGKLKGNGQLKLSASPKFILLNFSFQDVPVKTSVLISNDRNVLTFNHENEHAMSFVFGESASTIQTISGTMPGMKANLNRRADDQKFEGIVDIHLEDVAWLLPNTLSALRAEWDLKGQCVLNGFWDLEKGPYFEGSFEGSHCCIKNRNIEKCSSFIAFTPKTFRFSHFEAKDQGSTIRIPTGDIDPETGSFILSQVIMDNLSPNCFGINMPFHISHLELDSFKGNLLKSESWQTEGFGEWKNLSYDASQMASIQGIDPLLLIPNSGFSHFLVSKGKVYLTKLKDTYSIGKQTKFQLAKEGESFLDFDGNLQINLRIKQHNLLLKLTELFLLNIEGTCDHPKFSLQSRIDK